MNSTLKYTILPLVLLVLVVFGVTLISLNVGSSDKPEEEESGPLTGPALTFIHNEMRYDPRSGDPVLQSFPGFYEVGETYHRAAFWFLNKHPAPVRFGVAGRSCTSCTSARLAMLPANFRSTMTVRAAVVGGVAAPPEELEDLVPPLMAPLTASFTWHDFDFERPDDTIADIPAGQPEAPTWGVFELIFKVSGLGPKTLDADVALRVGERPPEHRRFRLFVAGVPPFLVSPQSIALGDLPEGAAPIHREVSYWSATRDFATLPPPNVNVNGSDRFVQIGGARPLSEAELARLATEQASEGQMIRIQSGYRFPVTIYRRLPDPSPGQPAEPDIGPFERQIGVSGPAGYAATVPVTAHITGLVTVTEGKVLDLKDFNGKAGTERMFNIVSDRSDLQLEPLPAEFKPAFLKVNLSEPRAEVGRRFWSLKVIVPPESTVAPLPADSVIVLRATTGGQSQKVRLPVKGTASARGR